MNDEETTFGQRQDRRRREFLVHVLSYEPDLSTADMFELAIDNAKIIQKFTPGSVKRIVRMVLARADKRDKEVLKLFYGIEGNVVHPFSERERAYILNGKRKDKMGERGLAIIEKRAIKKIQPYVQALVSLEEPPSSPEYRR